MKSLLELPQWMALKESILYLGLKLPSKVHKNVVEKFNDCANALSKLAFNYSAAQQKWLREEHNIHIVIDREGLDSDEMCFVYEVTYLKPDDVGSKHWVGNLTRVRSFQEYVGSYSGGWDTYEQALAEAVKFSLTLIEKP